MISYLNNNLIINKKFYTKSQDNLAYIEEPEVITMDSFNKAPWVSTYYFNTKPFINENIIIPFYCTNYKQSEYLKDSCVKIMVEIEKDGDIIRKIVNAGNNAINIGSFTNPGEQHITIQVTDLSNHYKSNKEVIQFYVIDENYAIKDSETYTMTVEDLTTYGIDNTNNEDETVRFNNALNINTFLKEKRDAGYRKVILLNQTGEDIYRIDPQGNVNNCVTLPSGLTLDGNGATIRQHVYYSPTGVGSSCIVRTANNCFDTHLINIKVVGDYAEHNLGPRYDEDGNQINQGFEAEGFSGILFGGAFCSMKDIEMSYISSYAFGGAGIGSNHATQDLRNSLIKGSINLITGEFVETNQTMVSGYKDVATFDSGGWMNPQNAMDHKFLTVGVQLGYSGLIGPTNLIYLAYYDENKTYLGYHKGMQFCLFERPDNTKYIRIICCVSDSSQLPSTGLLRLMSLNYMANTSIEIENFYAHDTRSCLTYPMFNRVHFNNCRFSYIAKETEYPVTKLMWDNEDGSYNGFNLYFENCIDENKVANGGFNLIHGTNCIFMNNIGVDPIIWQCNSVYINYDCNIKLRQKKSGLISRYLRCSNLTINNDISIIDDIDNAQRAFKNCVINSPKVEATFIDDNSYQFIDCVFNTNSVSGNHLNSIYNFKDGAIYIRDGVYRNCIFNPYNNSQRIQIFNPKITKKCLFKNQFIIELVNNNKACDCIFDDVQFSVNVVNDENTCMLIKDCNINFSRPLIHYSPFNYTVGTYSNIIFENCNLNCINDNLTNLIDIYAKPQNSYITFKNCVINNLSETTYIVDGIDQYKNNIKNVNIKFINTYINENQNLIADKYKDLNEINIVLVTNL